MEKGTHIPKRAGARGIAKLAAALLLAAVAQDIAADENFNPVSADFEKEIKQQGAAALQEMTHELKQDANWGKLGVEKLEAALKQQIILNDQVVENINLPECKDCHNRSKRS
ncbi:MAG: hypothetical protein ABFS39_14135 [Pseudomonadota bacterium]